MKKPRTFSLKITVAQYVEIQARANSIGVSMSDIVRMAVSEFLRKKHGI